MDANKKLNKLIYQDRIKRFGIGLVALILLIIALALTFNYFYNEEWSHRIVSGIVNKITVQPSDGNTQYVIEIDADGRVIFISEFYPPEVQAGDMVQVKITSNESGTKNKYFRLRSPRN